MHFSLLMKFSCYYIIKKLNLKKPCDTIGALKTLFYSFCFLLVFFFHILFNTSFSVVFGVYCGSNNDSSLLLWHKRCCHLPGCRSNCLWKKCSASQCNVFNHILFWNLYHLSYNHRGPVGRMYVGFYISEIIIKNSLSYLSTVSVMEWRGQVVNVSDVKSKDR